MENLEISRPLLCRGRFVVGPAFPRSADAPDRRTVHARFVIESPFARSISIEAHPCLHSLSPALSLARIVGGATRGTCPRHSHSRALNASCREYPQNSAIVHELSRHGYRETTPAAAFRRADEAIQHVVCSAVDLDSRAYAISPIALASVRSG